MFFTIPVSPKPTPRPRLGRGKVFNTKEYTSYKKSLIEWISVLGIPRDDYDMIHARFYVPYPKSTPKKNQIDNAPLKQCFDCDNVIKGLCDALEQANVIENDRGFFSMIIQKYRTTAEGGFISFELKKLKNDKESPISN